MKDYKAIIFDLGNVVFHCSFEPTIEYWAEISGQDKEELKKGLYFGSYHDDFEKSLITPNGFRQYISRQINYNLTELEFEQGWNAIYRDTIDGIDNLLNGLRQSYRIAALTNTNETHSKIWKVKYKETLNLFEKVFSSHEIKTRKPEESAYQNCLDYLGVTPEMVLFLDDKVEYIEGAAKLGIDSILVDSFEQMESDLEGLGIKIKKQTS